MLSMYPACFYKEDNGGYSVVFPDLNYLATQGDNLEDAMSMAIDCLAGFLYISQMDGDIIPPPSKLSDINPQAIAEELEISEPPHEAFVNMVSVDVAAYAREHFNKSVKKTLTIPQWLNDAAVNANINFSQTLQEALKTKLQLQ